MSAQGIRWVLAGSMLVSLAACDVSFGECEKTDAGECVDLFPDIDSGGTGGGANAGGDASAANGDANMDGGGASGGDGGGTVKPGEPLTKTEFCEAQLAPGKAWAELTDRCCVGGASSDALARMLAVVGYPGGIADCERNIEMLLAGGTVKYEPTAAAACATAFAANYAPPPSNECPAAGFSLPDIEAQYGHGLQVIAQIPACRATFQGVVANDKPCTKTLECADARSACLTAPGGIRTCQPALTEGTCEQATECASGYICKGADGNRVCVRVNDLGISGARCKGSAECSRGLWCNPDPAADRVDEPFACTGVNVCNPAYAFCAPFCTQ